MKKPEYPKHPGYLTEPVRPAVIHYIESHLRVSACGLRENFIISEGDGWSDEIEQVDCSACLKAARE